MTILSFFLVSISTLTWNSLKASSVYSLVFKAMANTFLEWSSVKLTKYYSPPRFSSCIKNTSVWIISRILNFIHGRYGWKATKGIFPAKQFAQALRAIPCNLGGHYFLVRKCSSFLPIWPSLLCHRSMYISFWTVFTSPLWSLACKT